MECAGRSDSETHFSQCSTRAGIAGRKNRSKGRKAIGGADASRTNPAELRSSASDPGASGFDPVSEQAVVGRQQRTESSTESIGGCEYQTGFGLIGCVWRVWTKDAAGVGEGRYGRHGQTCSTGTLEPEAQDRGYSARAGGKVNRSSPLPDRRVV